MHSEDFQSNPAQWKPLVKVSGLLASWGQRGYGLKTSWTGSDSALNVSTWSQSRKSSSVSLQDFYQSGPPVMLEHWVGMSKGMAPLCKGPWLGDCPIGSGPMVHWLLDASPHCHQDFYFHGLEFCEAILRTRRNEQKASCFETYFICRTSQFSSRKWNLRPWCHASSLGGYGLPFSEFYRA